MRYLLIYFCACLLFSSCNTDKTPPAKSIEKTTYYQEDHRPKFHFSPEANWMNDPNGMVYYEGEYHLFYQYYPDSTVWGPMHWGHAVSPDMVQWEHLPVALYPDSLGLIFSGSAVIDWDNTSGFGEDGQPPMIAIFTHHDMEGERAGTKKFQYQSIAYSNDKGRSWTKYAGNPVVPNPGIKDFRDPKVIWHEDTQRWIMVFAAYDKVRIYHSPNLKDWTFASEFGIPDDQRLWECPDLFPMKVVGTNDTKWILITSIQKEGPNGGTATSYFVGDFDGVTFTGNNKDQHWLDYGRDNYALVTWSDIPKEDGRRLALGWMSNWQYAQIVPTEKWRSAMTLPRELILKKTTEGLRLYSQPVKELQKIRGEKVSIKEKGAAEKIEMKDQISFPLSQMEMIVEWELPDSGAADLVVEWANAKGETYRFGYESESNTFYSDRTKSGKTNFSEDFAKVKHTAPRFSKTKNLKLHFFVDAASVEIFTDDGQVVFTEILFPEEDYSELTFYNKNGQAMLVGVDVFELKSVW